MTDIRNRRWLMPAGLVAACVALAVPAAAQAGTANAGIAGAPASNPIAGLTWGHYTGDTIEKGYPVYQKATGEKKKLLAEVALRPEAYWIGSWNKEPRAAVSGYISNVENGNPNVLAQLTDFGIAPWENKAYGKTPSAKATAHYKTWTNEFAAGIGDSRALVVMQPDYPVVWSKQIPAKAKTIYHKDMQYAVSKLNALTHTTVYIDGGAADWQTYGTSTVKMLAKLLSQSGIRQARGFALDATHFDSTADNIKFGKKVVAALSKMGIKNKHFIIDTAENGSPFTHQSFTKATGSGAHWAARPGCKKRGKPRFCQTFGIPPTWQTGSSSWHLGAQAKVAAKYVDGYVWFGRPWLHGQVDPFDPSLVEQMARSTPFPFTKFPNTNVTGVTANQASAAAAAAAPQAREAAVSDGSNSAPSPALSWPTAL